MGARRWTGVALLVVGGCVPSETTSEPVAPPPPAPPAQVVAAAPQPYQPQLRTYEQAQAYAQSQPYGQAPAAPAYPQAAPAYPQAAPAYPQAVQYPVQLPVLAPLGPSDSLRPPKPTPVASVPAPRLPKLNEQLIPFKAHNPKGRQDDFSCGTVWTGEEEVALDCRTSKDPQVLGPAAVALIPYELLRPARATMPVTVDHRLDGFEGPVRRQGAANTCTAQALAAQIDHSIGLWTGKPGNVSAMQLWARYHKGGGAERANLGLSVANEPDWPYDAARAKEMGACKTPPCLTDDEQHKLDGLEGKAVAVLEQVERIPENETMYDVMEAKIAAGRDVGTGGHLPKPFKPVGDPGSKYIPDFTEIGKGIHAFTLVGYTHVDNERYFLIKNSWGPAWGDGGYAWIHEQSLRKFAHDAYVVVVDPINNARRRQRSRAAAIMCPPGQAPDSVDGACKQLCADGAPRHDGYCGTTEDCASGFVNVEGYCVLAAPTARGVEPRNGIQFSCSPSGCVYTFPQSVGACATAQCQKSCPAPDFRLGTGQRGLICLE